MFVEFSMVAVILSVEHRETYDFARFLTKWQDDRPDPHPRHVVQATAVIDRVRQQLAHCRRGDLVRVKGDITSRERIRPGQERSVIFNELWLLHITLLVRGFSYHAMGKCKTGAAPSTGNLHKREDALQ